MYFSSYQQILEYVESHIAQLDWSNRPANLYEPIRYFMQLGGKRLRPVLVMMANDMYDAPPDNAIHAALAIEIFHNFTLVHDDIMDRAELRRGKPTVHQKWNENIAILSGDLMLIKAIENLAQSNSQVLPALLKVFNDAATWVCEGQQLDMDFETQSNVSVEDYIEMITLKTAVLLGASLQIGAIAAGATDSDAQHLYEFGKNIGIAFQIQDDLLDSFGNAADVGKTIGGDIAANKKTLLWVETLNRASQDDKAKLMQLLQLSDTTTKVKEVLALYKQYEIDEVCNNYKQHYLQQAYLHLDEVTLPAEKKVLLKNTSSDLLHRIK